MKICPKCNEEISDNDSKFCPKCGIELNNSDNENINSNKLVDDANNTLNNIVNQIKIEKNYIKYRLEDNDKTQLKGNEFIISEKIANTIENITKEKENEKREQKTKIKIDDEK